MALKVKPGDMVFVEWVDSTQVNYGWDTPERYTEANYLVPVRTLGFVVAINKKTLLVVQNGHPPGMRENHVSNAMVIPRVVIKRLKRVKT